METKLTHPTYKFVDEKDADAFAWVFVEANAPMKKVAIKFPPLGPQEIRMKVTHAGLCHTDSLICRGGFGPAPYPLAPGHEICGVITHLGPEVKDFKVGEKVAFGTQRESCDKCDACVKDYEVFCTGPLTQRETYGPHFWGGYATSIQQPAKFYQRIPENLPIEKVPPLLCAGITVYNPISKHCKPGDSLAVIGIGGLGHLAVMYGKAWGCKVTAFTTSSGKEEFIKKLGADKVVVSTPENMNAEAGKYDVVLSALPMATDLTPYIRLCKFLGQLVMVGAPPITEQDKMTTIFLLLNQVTISTSGTGSRKKIREMLEFSSKHNIVPLCEQYDFEKFPEAFDRMENGKPIFRVVVDASKAGPESVSSEHSTKKNNKNE